MKKLLSQSSLRNRKPPRLRALLIAALLGFIAIAAPAAITVSPWTPHRVGVDVATGFNPSPLQRVWCMRIDLRNPEVTLYATQHQGTKETINQTTLAFMNAHPTLAGAINANFFDPGTGNGAHVDVKGLLIANGVVVSPASAASFSAQCSFTADGAPSITVSGTTPTGKHGSWWGLDHSCQWHSAGTITGS